jgi:hypothetical protein
MRLPAFDNRRAALEDERPNRGALLFAVALVALAVGVVVGSGLLRRAPIAPNPGEPALPLPSAAAADEAEVPAGQSALSPAGTAAAEGVGFARDAAGAVAAATSYQLTLGDLHVALDDTARDDVVRRVAASSALEELSAALARGAEATRAGGLDAAAVALQRQVPLGYDLIRFTPERATVDLWAVQVLSLGDAVPLEARYGTVTVELVWERDDWRLVRFASTEGPTPELQGDGEHLRTIEAIERFTEYAYAPA